MDKGKEGFCGERSQVPSPGPFSSEPRLGLFRDKSHSAAS